MRILALFPWMMTGVWVGACSSPEVSPTPGHNPIDAGSDAADASGADTDWEAAFAHVLPADHVVNLRLTFAPSMWEKLLDDWQTTQQKNRYPAEFNFDSETLAQVGVRLKGFNSLNIPPDGPIDLQGKYPLKIDFNSQGGPRFHSIDELSLNTSGNDPSRMRERLTARMYQAMGVDAARTAWANVSINEHLIGIYVLAQVIDKRFLKDRFGTQNDADDGNLYKCVYNSFNACSLAWKGSDKAAYVSTTECSPGFDKCGLVLQTNEDDPQKNDYQDLIHFLDVLHHTPQAELEAELPKVFDVDHFVKLAAVAYATSNFDSYFGKGHNYYLYRRSDERFQMIPWDFDLAYGAIPCASDIADPTCGQMEGHPLTERILGVPAFRAQYLAALRTVAEQWLTVEQHAAWIAEADALLRPLVDGDPNPPLGAFYAEQIDPKGEGNGNLFDIIKRNRSFILGALPPP